MRIGKWWPLAVALMVTGGTATAADDYLRDAAEVRALLSGATLTGVYLRSQSNYVLVFEPDGTLTDAAGATARWWVNDTAQYCREWLSGRLAGNTACMDVAHDDARLSIYHGDNKVAEGELSRP